MPLPVSFRTDIADKIVRTVAPVTIALMIVMNLIGFSLWGHSQHNRLIPIAIMLLFMPMAWILALRGRAIAGTLILLIGLNIAVIAGMVFGGGIFAISYIGVFAIITICSAVYGPKAGLVYTVVMILVGALFTGMDAMGLVQETGALPPMYFLSSVSLLFGCQLFFVSVPIKLLFKALSDVQRTASELEGILERTPNIIFKTNKTGEIQFINQAVSRYGYQVDQLLCTDIKRFLHPEDRREAENIFAGDTEEAVKGNFRIVLPHLQQGNQKKGDKKRLNTFIVTMEAFQIESGYSGEFHTVFQGIARDITKEQAYETQLRYFEAVMEQSGEEIVIYDLEGFILYTNPSFEEKSGYSKDELRYKNIVDIMEEHPDEVFYRETWSAISEKRPWKGEGENRRKDGKIFQYDASITPIVDSKGETSAFFSLRQDITDKIKTARQLQQAQKMEAIGTLAGGIAHDFNNILGAIMGYAELVKQDLSKASLSYGRQQRVIAASVRAKKLVEQILLFSRQSDQVIKPMQPHLIINEALKLLRSSIPTTIEIKQYVPGNLGSIVADPTQIHQIVMNLCTNAYHAMREQGGLLSVTLSKSELQKDDITFAKVEFDPGTYLVLEVSDTGHGMDKATIGKVFDPYFTTKPKGEGTGMGLSVVHGIVKTCNGHIQIYSEPGEGTNIRVYFPRVDTSGNGLEVNPNQKPQTGNETILVIDDEPDILEMMKLSLESLGYSTFPFSEGLDALAAFEADAEKFDLIITDMTMPKMTGLDLAKRILDIKPGMPIVLCTGFSELVTREKAEALGIMGFVLKPVLRKDLAAEIRQALDQKI